MSITATDIQYRLSTKSGSAGDTTASTPADSLGKYASTTQLSGTALGNLFDDITGDENAAADVEYRCLFVHNASAVDTWVNVVVWLSAEVAGGANTAISVDTTPASDIDSASAQAKEITDEQTAPASQSFSSPTTKGTGLSVGTLAPDQCRAIWVRRTATNSSPVQNDGVTLRCEGDTL